MIYGISNPVAVLVGVVGGSGGASSSTTSVSRLNAGGSTIYKGQPVYLSSATQCQKALSTTASTAAVGVASANAISAAATDVLLEGIVTQSDWTNVIGSATLTTGSKYYLSATAGQLTLTPTDALNYVYQYIGIALSTTELFVQIEPPIIL